MSELWAYLPGVIILLFLSGFFSGSEAAFFSLTPTQRQRLREGSRAEQFAFGLLRNPERLLMGILFWNLAINIAYFSLASKVSLRTEAINPAILSILALLLIVLCGEFLPKSIAVTYPLQFVRTLVVPLAFSIRLIDFFLPAIRLINEASRRVLWPGFESETYLELGDLDRAIEQSTEDEHLFEQEGNILRNVIRLSEIRVEEWMRPRTQYRSFVAPVHIDDLEGQRTPSGYMLVTDQDGRDIQSFVDLSRIRPDSPADLSGLVQPLVVVPWCATVADALTKLKERGQRVAVVVNEFGESVGILTWEEIFEAILHLDNTQSQRALAKAEIHPEGEGVWLATGMTKLRRLERVLGRRLEGQNLTIGGVIQEQLHRLAEKGDSCHFDGLDLEVIDEGQPGEILVRIHTHAQQQEDES